MVLKWQRSVDQKIDMTGDGSFETAAGLRATRINFNAGNG
jgi:predicted secreted protein